MRITIDGPQGCGKSLLANALRAIITMSGKVAVVFDNESAVPRIKPRPGVVYIVVRQTKR